MNRSSKKVCLITPNHIATNPRLVKEASALADAGFQVHIIFSQHVASVVEDDFKILESLPSVTYDCLDWTGGSIKSKLYRLSGGILRKISPALSRFFLKPLFEKINLNRNYLYQLRAAVDSKADLFIAHNVGALPVAGDAAARLGKNFAFDAEDYHRGEALSEETINNIVKTENEYIPKAVYLSAASPLIGREYEMIYRKEAIIINNVFPVVERSLSAEVVAHPSLKLFWFSQSVGSNRGIQDVIRAMRMVEKLDLELHLYGHPPSSVKEEFDSLMRDLNFTHPPGIFFKGIVPPDELLSKASQFDIGFAIEPGFCKNNQIALSNKIFTYLLGGNAIVFSDTPAQSEFYERNRDIGLMYAPGDAASLAKILETYYFDRALLNKHKAQSRELFEKKYNWDLLRNVFIQLIDDCFKKSASPALVNLDTIPQSS